MAFIKKIPEPHSTNGSKIFLQKMLIVSLSLVIGLIATVWAITWSATESHIDKTELAVKENTKSLNEIEKFVAQQVIINENQEKYFGDSHELMLQILKEIKK